MADVAKLPGVFEQIKLVGGVRWQILKNNLRRKNNRWDLVGMIWVGFFAAALVVGLAFAFFAGGYGFVEKGRGNWLGLLYWCVFVWWQVFPLFVMGFGSQFQFATLLRFPLRLRAFYLLSLGYGFTDFGAMASICWVFSMVAGATVAQPTMLPPLLLVSLLFILLNVTLERLIGSWMEKLLAKRRWREIFVAVFVLSMVSLNFLNPAFQRWGKGIQPRFLQFVPYLNWTPGSLAGNGAAAAAVWNTRGFLVTVAGLSAWLVLLTILLWRRYGAQYAGEEISDSPGPARRRSKERRTESTKGELAPGLLSPQVSGVIAKEFRYLTRNGFTFLTLIIPPIMVMFFAVQFGPGSLLKEHSLKAPLFFQGILAYLILILMTPAYNSFAYEGKGIQTYFMAPLGFREVLLGKNLFLAAVIAVELVLAFSLLMLRIGWPGTTLFFSMISAGAFAVIGQFTIANWSSLSFPKKMDLGKMKGQRNSAVSVWTAFGAQILVGAICAFVFALGGWMANPWLPVLVFVALTAAALGGYVSSLDALGRLAEKKKELLIETLCR
jgi:ABC-2 type transport system permease protein